MKNIENFLFFLTCFSITANLIEEFLKIFIVLRGN